MNEQSIHAEIRRREVERMSALVRADWGLLEAILAEDLVHIHATGVIEDKAAYLEGARTKLEFKRVERESMHLRTYGDVVISTGIIDQTLALKSSGTLMTLRTAATQVWARQGKDMRICSFQNTRIA